MLVGYLAQAVEGRAGCVCFPSYQLVCEIVG
jgi:hypothetical protein